ncbi:hypothetical protein TOTORO_01450 [Serratia phage vB_SmaS-Totoro]|nr:hypothetical protein TOTORO_01450 [Serratia phage vB_SmaS-Totoro]
MNSKLLDPVKSGLLILISALIVSFFSEEESVYTIFKVIGLYTVLEIDSLYISGVITNKSLGNPKKVYANSKYYAEVNKAIYHFFLVDETPYDNVNRIIVEVTEATEKKLNDKSPLIKAFAIAILESQNWSMKDILEAELFIEQYPEEIKSARDFVETVG